jgi:hypothetical protein
MGVSLNALKKNSKVMYLRIIYFFLLSLIAISCTEEKIVPGKVPELPLSPDTNSSPTDFEVVIQDLSSNSAVLNWGPIYDLDQDSIYSAIFINGTMIAHQENDFVFKLTDLKPEKEYTGKVVVTDSISAPKEMSFSFTTKKHFIRFDKTYTNNYDGNFPAGYAMTKTTDGGYAIAGSIRAENQNGTILMVLKVDSLGYEQWHTQVSGNTAGVAIIQAKDKGFVMVGSAVTKIDASGELQWQHLSPSWTQQYNAVVETDDLGYLVVGMESSAAARGSMTKFSVDGTQQWEKFFDGEASTTMSTCGDIVKTSDNNYVIAGAHQKPTVDFELATAEIDAQGNILWIKNYAHEWQTFYEGITLETLNDGFIVGSTSIGGDSHARMVKIGQDGSIVWDHTWNYPWCNAVRATKDGNYIFVGGSYSSAAILIKVGSNGELLWEKIYEPAYPESSRIFQDVVETDSGLALLGIKNQHLWLLKTDDNGE